MLDVQLKTLTLNEPFRIAHGASAERQVVRVRAEGAIGEAPFVPYYHDDPVQTVEWLRSIEDTFGPQDPEGPRPALLALDLLRWDRQGKRDGKTLEALLKPLLGDLPRRDGPVSACRSFSIPTDLDSFRSRVQETARQFRVLKLKLGSGNVDFDEAIVAMAREAAPEAELIVDVNGGWSVSDTLQMLKKLRRWGPALVEQPVHHADGLEPWREIAAKKVSEAPLLFADETAQTAADVPALAELVSGVNVKLLKCRTLEGAIAMIRAARQHRLRLLLGCMIETSVGVTAAAHLARWVDWVDLDGHLYVSNDDATGISFDGAGILTLPAGSGLGATIPGER